MNETIGVIYINLFLPKPIMSSIQLTSADTGGSQFTARLNPGEIKIVYSAKIARTELDKCIGAPLDRNYYYVLENGIEYNHPSCFHIIEKYNNKFIKHCV